MANEIYIAVESGSCDIKGESFTFARGVTRVRAGHPLLKAVPDYFEPIDDHVTFEHGKAKAEADAKRHEENLATEAEAAARSDVEQATAAPGEKRKGRRGKKTATEAEEEEAPAEEPGGDDETPASEEPADEPAPEPGGLTMASLKGE